MKYLELAQLYEKLFSTTKRLEKTYFVSEFLKKANENINETILLVQGRIFPAWDSRKIGLAARLVLKALSLSTGISQENIERDWKEVGDLGLVTEKITEHKLQSTLFSSELTVKKVFTNLQKISEFEGQGTVDKKIKVLSELLTSAKPIESKYIVRTVLEEMRVGLGEGTFRDAIAWAFFAKPFGVFFVCDKCSTINPQVKKCVICKSEINLKQKEVKKDFKMISINFDEIENKKYELHKYDIIISDKPREVYNYLVSKVQSAFDVSTDFSEVVSAVKKEGIKGLEKIKIKIGNPIKVMLALKEPDIKSAFERVKKPAAVEYKYDGFRLLIHKSKEKVILYTRRLENVSAQFPEVVERINKYVKADSVILDSEAVGFDPKTKKYLPFQSISQRIKRKYDIQRIAKEFPVELNVFDLIYLDGESLLNTPFKERRDKLESVLFEKEKEIVLAKHIITSDEKEAQKMFEDSIKIGNEGLMFKTVDAPYKPGARVGYMVKFKSTMDPLDLVIVGAEWGEGKRKGWLSTFVVACQSNGTDELLEIGKVGTGIKEKEGDSDSNISNVTFEQLTKLLEPLIISEKNKEVRVQPKIVLSVLYEEIQKSPTYSSGYALRFPRVVALREDKAIDEIAFLDEIEDEYHHQKGKE